MQNPLGDRGLNAILKAIPLSPKQERKLRMTNGSAYLDVGMKISGIAENSNFGKTTL